MTAAAGEFVEKGLTRGWTKLKIGVD